MKKLLFLAIVFFAIQHASAQGTINESNEIYNTAGIDVKPNFPGGIERFYKFIGSNFRVPEKEGLKGKVYVSFVVEKDGTLADIKVMRDIGFGTGEETIRVLKLSPNWIPGEQNGKKVRVLYSLPISISTPESKKTDVKSSYQDPNFKTDVLKLFSVNGVDTQVNILKTQILKKITEDKKGDFLKEFDASFLSYQGKMAEVYMEVYTPEDIKGMIVFYESPVGKKMNEKSSELRQKSLSVGPEWYKELKVITDKYKEAVPVQDTYTVTKPKS